MSKSQKQVVQLASIWAKVANYEVPLLLGLDQAIDLSVALEYDKDLKVSRNGSRKVDLVGEFEYSYTKTFWRYFSTSRIYVSSIANLHTLSLINFPSFSTKACVPIVRSTRSTFKIW